MNFIFCFSKYLLYVIFVSFLMECMVFGDAEPQDRRTAKHVIIGHSAILACKLSNNSGITKVPLGYTWMKNKVDVTVDPRFTVLLWGGLLVRRTVIEDTGTYKCTARTLSEKDVPKVYRGLDVEMDIMYPPTVILTKAEIVTTQRTDVQLPCTSRGNPSVITTKWMFNEKPLPKSFHPLIFPNGTLLLRNVNTEHEGIYKCSPLNKIGLGKSSATLLKVEAQPLFTQVPPRTLTAKLGETLTMLCNATTFQVTWSKVNASLPEFRSFTRGGNLHIRDVQLEDSGVYECKVSSVRKTLSRSVEVLVVSTPVPPVIKNVKMLSKSAVVSWERGYNGGSRQTLEIWYRRTNSDDYNWKTIRNIPEDLSSYAVYDIEPRQSYLFSMRGVNRMGFGIFGRIFRAAKFSSTIHQTANSKAFTKPLAPIHVSCNRTNAGYKMSWSYKQTPGRPQVQYFLIEYRKLNSSLEWQTIDDLINSETRQWSIGTEILNPNVPYEFRMFSYGGSFSEPSEIVKPTDMTDNFKSLIIRSNGINNSVLIAVCFVSVTAVLLIFAVYCYCYRVRKKSRKKDSPKVHNRKYKLAQPYSSTESTLTDSEFDSCDLHDVKFVPNVSTFVLESQGNAHKSYRKKASRIKCDHKLMPCSEQYVASAFAGTLVDKSNTQNHKANLQQDCFVQNYDGYFCSQDVPTVFNTGRLLPEFPELRDSYDQFCTTMSEDSSRDDLDGKLSKRGSDMSVLSEPLKSARGMARGSRCSSDEMLENVHACKRRRKTILERVDADGKTHRWSMPEFTKLWHENCGGDPDYYLNSPYDSIVQENDGQSYSEHSTSSCTTPALSNTNSYGSLIDGKLTTSDYTNIEEQISADKKRQVLIGESNSCPTLVSVEPLTSFDARDYDSSGFHEGSGDDSATSSPTHSRASVNTIKENPRWHGFEPNLKDSGIYADEDVDSSSSVGEINVYANDSGYSGMCNGTRDSPEGEETNLNESEEIHADNVQKIKQFTPIKKLPEHSSTGTDSVIDDKDMLCVSEPQLGHVCTRKAHEDTHLEKETMDERKDKRCAQLMQEYVVNRTLDSYTPSSSFYRTSAV